MNISILIKYLQSIQDQEGDLNVLIKNRDNGGYYYGYDSELEQKIVVREEKKILSL